MYTQQAILKTRAVLGLVTRRYDTSLELLLLFAKAYVHSKGYSFFLCMTRGHTGESGIKDPYIHLGNMGEVTGQFHTPFAYASEKAMDSK